jgi:chromate transporter
VRTRATPLRELARLFLRLGSTAFGGPAAHVALMEDEIVRRRGWLAREEFVDLVGATNLIPGPNSTELALHIGLRRAGLAGLCVAGACFILPAAGIVLGFAWAYVRFGMSPAALAFLDGVKPVVLALLAQALWSLGRTAARTAPLALLGAAALVLAALGVNELAVLGLAAVAAALAYGLPRAGSSGARAGLVPFVPPGAVAALTSSGVGSAAVAAVTPAAGAASAGALFLVFAKIGSVLFGSGYVLVAFLQSELVDRRGWLTAPQLLDAIAIGQVTPGPLFTSATFVGYLLAGPAGAAAATVGIFLPAFVLVALSAPLVPRLRRSPLAGALLDGVNVASLALMAFASARLARDALVDLPSVALAVVAAVLLLRFRVGSGWLVAAGALAGGLRAALG